MFILVRRKPDFSNAQIHPIPIAFYTSSLSIDGWHEAAAWTDADSASGFFQIEPSSGDPASQPTICYIAYDNDNIYLSVNLYQDTEVLARAMSR